MLPDKPVRRFDVFAEYTRLERLDKGDAQDVAKGYGIWLAKLVASRRGRSKDDSGSTASRRKPGLEPKFRSLNDNDVASGAPPCTLPATSHAPVGLRAGVALQRGRGNRDGISFRPAMLLPGVMDVTARCAPVDDIKRQIAEICRAAASVVAEDVADPLAFSNHPQHEAACGFLHTLNGIAIWGTNAETWDDQLLANYVVCGDNIAQAVRIGADAYYEVIRQLVASGEVPESDPDTCLFEELAKWQDCISTCAPDDPVCRLTCF